MGIKYILLLSLGIFIFYQVSRFIWKVSKIYRAVKQAINQQVMDANLFQKEVGDVIIKQNKNKQNPSSKANDDEYVDFEEIK